LPEPVGAWISVCAPEAITGQPRSCAGVGARNAFSNHVRVSGLKTESALTLARVLVPRPRAAED